MGWNIFRWGAPLGVLGYVCAAFAVGGSSPSIGGANPIAEISLTAAAIFYMGERMYDRRTKAREEPIAADALRQTTEALHRHHENEERTMRDISALLRTQESRVNELIIRQEVGHTAFERLSVAIDRLHTVSERIAAKLG